jgi:hypothetical protein
MSGSLLRWGAAAPVIALALAAASPALAQGRQLVAGGVVEGEVAGSGSSASFPLRAAPGQTLQLDAIPAPGSPDGLDLLMKVYDPAGELVGEDDDGGGALNPRVTLTSEAGGLYRVEVDVLGEGGAFTLLARESVVVPQVTTALTLTGGRAERAVAFPGDDESLFTFEGRRGEAYSITFVADEPDGDDAADPMLELFPGEGTAAASLGSDDDSGGGLNSRIVTELPEDGTYTVRVSSLSSKGTARLAVAKMTLRPAPVGNLAYGTPVIVSFGENSPFVVGDSTRRLVPYALFRLPASPAPVAMAGRNQTIVIRATSEGLDPYLEVGLDTPLGFATVLSNDDADNLDARLVLDPAKFGTGEAADWWRKLRIRVSAPVGSAGDVELTAEPTAD